jgi:hypothetical protein
MRFGAPREIAQSFRYEADFEMAVGARGIRVPRDAPYVPILTVERRSRCRTREEHLSDNPLLAPRRVASKCPLRAFDLEQASSEKQTKGGAVQAIVGARLANQGRAGAGSGVMSDLERGLRPLDEQRQAGRNEVTRSPLQVHGVGRRTTCAWHHPQPPLATIFRCSVTFLV